MMGSRGITTALTQRGLRRAENLKKSVVEITKEKRAVIFSARSDIDVFWTLVPKILFSRSGKVDFTLSAKGGVPLVFDKVDTICK